MSDNEKQPTISVIVPIYNVEKYLKKCLDSIVQQTFNDIEIICVNDGSTDNSQIIIDEYKQKDNRIKNIIKENGGLSSARNAGLNIAKGKYISFIDPDDYIDLDAYAQVVEEFNRDRSIDIVSFNYEIINEAGSCLEKKNVNSIFLNGIHKVSDKLIKNIFVSACTHIFKRTIIEKNNLKFPIGLLYEDNFFTPLYLIFCNKISFLPNYFYKYLVRNNSITATTKHKKGRAIHFILVCEAVLNYLKEKKLFENKNKMFFDLFYRVLESAISNAPQEEKEDIYAKAKNILKNNVQLNKDYLDLHYNELINLTKYEGKKYSFFHIIKIKHRISYDTISFLFLPIYKIKYTQTGISIYLFSIFKLYKKTYLI